MDFKEIKHNLFFLHKCIRDEYLKTFILKHCYGHAENIIPSLSLLFIGKNMTVTSDAYGALQMSSFYE